MSATLAGIRLRALRISAENFAAIQTLTTALVLSLTRPQPQRRRVDGAAAEVCDRRLLWRFGISGDRPISWCRPASMQGLGLLRSLAQALRLWSWGGVACDLVVVNAEPASYQMALQRELAALRERHAADSAAPARRRRPPACTCCAPTSCRDDELSTLRAWRVCACTPTAARCCTMCRSGSSCTSRRFEQRHDDLDRRRWPAPRRAGARRAAPAGRVRADVGRVPLRRQRRAAPGAALDQRAGQPGLRRAALAKPAAATPGRVNSRLNQLTAWSNDPVADPPSRMVPAAGPQDAAGLERGAVGLGRRRSADLPRRRTARATASSATAAATWR